MRSGALTGHGDVNRNVYMQLHGTNWITSSFKMASIRARCDQVSGAQIRGFHAVDLIAIMDTNVRSTEMHNLWYFAPGWMIRTQCTESGLIRIAKSVFGSAHVGVWTEKTGGRNWLASPDLNLTPLAAFLRFARQNNVKKQQEVCYQIKIGTTGWQGQLEMGWARYIDRPMLSILLKTVTN